MKKVILLALVVALSGSMVRAQELAIGVKGGPNFASLHGGDAKNVYSNRTGFHVGAFALFKFSKIGIQPELLFSKQGSNFTDGLGNYKQNFSYFNIPVLLKLYTIAGINLQVGPQFGFVTAAKQTYAVNGGSSTTADIKSDLKGSDISAALGLGWDLPFGLSIDARYNLGLSKTSSNSSTNPSSNAKNQVFQLSIGYKLFKIGG